ncbi:MAG: GGDEF domain-containing protein [Treponema sp.]|nr:GGDEF domain-containing protein [Treponema sp.]
MSRKSAKSKIFFNFGLLTLTSAAIMFLGSALFVKDIILSIQSGAAIIFTLVLQLIWIKNQHKNIIFCIVFSCAIHLLIQITVAAFYMGWNAGFQNYCFMIFASSFLYIHEDNKKKARIHFHVTHLTSIFVYILISLRCHFAEPIKVFPPENIELTTQTNAVVIFGIGIFLAGILNANYKHSIRTLKYFAERDELTQLLNRHAIRRSFDDFHQGLLKQSINFGVCIFDIDNFNKLNETYGYDTGNKVLKKIGEILQDYDDDRTVSCRWDGDEFLIACKYGNDREDFVKKIEKIKNEISKQTFSVTGKKTSFSITLTAGISFALKELPIHKIIDLADRRVYWGKHNGKNQIVTNEDYFFIK